MPVRRSRWFARWRVRCRRLAAVAIVLPMLALAAEDNPGLPLRVPSNVAWTEETIAVASGGDPLRGLILARRCDRCHGAEGFSGRTTTPNLAAMDPLAFWKQLQDFRSGKRLSPVMQQMILTVPAANDPDLAAYYSMLPTTADPQDVRVFPSEPPSPAHASMASRLIALGDGRRGIPPCQSCHGPIAHVRGAPALLTQNAAYVLNQLEAFADGSRANDINVAMRSIAAALTEEERNALSEYYGAGLGLRPAGASGAYR